MMLRSVVIFLALLLPLSACTGKPPRELKSPCVSADVEGSKADTPCIRRPANASWIS